MIWELVLMILIYTIFKNKVEARKISNILLKKKLVGCVNMFPLEASYLWEGKIQNVKEVGCFIKTKKGYFNKVSKEIKLNNSYETPAIIEINVDDIDKRYNNWLNKEVVGK
jgi:periplasmic divalent cation tolerance protein